ncbi:hypothetical protein ACWEQC_12745 [Streptomyces shenzhenensis]
MIDVQLIGLTDLLLGHGVGERGPQGITRRDEYASRIQRGHGWENTTSARFLEALTAWAETGPGWYERHRRADLRATALSLAVFTDLGPCIGMPVRGATDQPA